MSTDLPKDGIGEGSLQTLNTEAALSPSVDTLGDNSLGLNSTIAGSGSAGVNGDALADELDEQEALAGEEEEEDIGGGEGLDGGSPIENLNEDDASSVISTDKDKKGKNKKKKKKGKDKQKGEDEGEEKVKPKGVTINPAFLEAQKALNSKKTLKEKILYALPTTDDLRNFKEDFDITDYLPYTHRLSHAERQKVRLKGTLDRSLDVNKIDPYIPAIKFRNRMDKRYEKFKVRKEEVLEMVANGEHLRKEMNQSSSY